MELATVSVFTGGVLYAVNGFFAGVLGIAGCMRTALLLGQHLPSVSIFVACDAPSNFLSLADHFIHCTFHVLLVNVPPLR